LLTPLVIAASLLFASSRAVSLRAHAVNSTVGAIHVQQYQQQHQNLTQRHAVHGQQQHQQSKSNLTQREPRVYFLFLAVDKVSNLDVWNAFFEAAPVDQYRAFVHCKLDACVQQVKGSVMKVVSTVPSYYCTDLVSPMNQLLAYALQDDVNAGVPNPGDKFAFISDSSLPAKPFAHIYETLRWRQGSDFCVFPSNEWADIPGPQGVQMAVKHHQWVTLSRSHAEKALKLWWEGRFHNFMAMFRMNAEAWRGGNNTFSDNRNFGCLDEFWYMVTLYGPLTQDAMQQNQMVSLSMFSGGQLLVSPQAGWQGECDTFVLWSQYLHIPGHNPFLEFHYNLDAMSVPHSGNSARPGWWDTITTHGLQAIRQSSFLFMRKFIDKPRLYDGPNFLEAYKQHVLAA